MLVIRSNAFASFPSRFLTRLTHGTSRSQLNRSSLGRTWWSASVRSITKNKRRLRWLGCTTLSKGSAKIYSIRYGNSEIQPSNVMWGMRSMNWLKFALIICSLSTKFTLRIWRSSNLLRYSERLAKSQHLGRQTKELEKQVSGQRLIRGMLPKRSWWLPMSPLARRSTRKARQLKNIRPYLACQRSWVSSLTRG